MSDPGESERPADDQTVDMPPCEQIQHARHFPSYPYNITRATLYSSYMNVLLVFFPIGLVAGALGWADLTVFCLNFLAIIPLASLIAFSTRELSGSVGVVLGRLLKATLSNIFEIIVRDPTFTS
jgi:Ca2+:H+ antiporter